MTTTRSAYSAQTRTPEAVGEILAGLSGAAPRVVVFFAGIAHDGELLGRALTERFPTACVIGCSTNGEFCDHGFGKGGVVALAITEEFVGDCTAVMADVGGDIESGMQAAADRIGERLGRPLRSLDPEHWAGVTLLEGSHGREERINTALGNVAPFLPVVGGSAGDNITFTRSWVFAEGRLSWDGTALLVGHMNTRFRTLKACNFVPTDSCVTVTRTDSERRLILELDGQPAADFYARKIGVDKEQLGFPDFLAHPLGLMIDGEAWLRSGVRREGDALFFACAVVEGARLHFMTATDLVEDTRVKLAQAAASLGAPIRGALLFNCAYRMLEAQIKGQEAAYHQVLSSLVHAGCQSNGESFLGHINQTLTGLIFG